MIGEFTQAYKACEDIYTTKFVIDFSKFREAYDTYWFILGNGDADPLALEIAQKHSPELYKKYLAQEKSEVGYSKTLPYKKMDMCDSRHIMMSAIIFSEGREYFSHIIEIGGGYGNWFRLNNGIVKFNRWTIIDLPFVLELQEWYLKQVTDVSKVEFVSAYDYVDNIPLVDSFDLVIGAHSLSEFSLETFVDYFTNILTKAEFFFYATQVGQDHQEKKLDLLSTIFDPIKIEITEEGAVHNILYKRR